MTNADDGENKARELFEKGKQLYHEKQYNEAAMAFREAYSLKKSWKLYFNIGQCEVLAKHYGLALEAFETYLAEGGDDVPGERQAETIKEIKRLQAMVGTIRVVGQAGDEVVINGRSYGALPRAKRVKVGVGYVAVRVERAGEAVVDTEVRVSSGETVDVSVAAKAGPVVASPMSDTAKEPEVDTENETDIKPAKRKWTWVALGIGAASGIAGGIIGGVALSKRGALLDDCENTTCSTDREEDRDAAKRMGLSADILYGVAGVGVVAGLVLFFVEPKLGKESNVAVAPSVLEEGAGLHIRGRF